MKTNLKNTNALMLLFEKDMYILCRELFSCCEKKMLVKCEEY